MLEYLRLSKHECFVSTSHFMNELFIEEMCTRRKECIVDVEIY